MSPRKPWLAVPAGAGDTHMHVYHAEVPPAPDEIARKKILVDNPAGLYGF